MQQHARSSTEPAGTSLSRRLLAHAEALGLTYTPFGARKLAAARGGEDQAREWMEYLAALLAYASAIGAAPQPSQAAAAKTLSRALDRRDDGDLDQAFDDAKRALLARSTERGQRALGRIVVAAEHGARAAEARTRHATLHAAEPAEQPARLADEVMRVLQAAADADLPDRARYRRDLWLLCQSEAARRDIRLPDSPDQHERLHLALVLVAGRHAFRQEVREHVDDVRAQLAARARHGWQPDPSRYAPGGDIDRRVERLWRRWCERGTVSSPAA